MRGKKSLTGGKRVEREVGKNLCHHLCPNSLVLLKDMGLGIFNYGTLSLSNYVCILRWDCLSGILYTPSAFVALYWPEIANTMKWQLHGMTGMEGLERTWASSWLKSSPFNSTKSSKTSAAASPSDWPPLGTKTRSPSSIFSRQSWESAGLATVNVEQPPRGSNPGRRRRRWSRSWNLNCASTNFFPLDLFATNKKFHYKFEPPTSKIFLRIFYF